MGFDNNFRMTSQAVNGAALAFGYDLDGLLTGPGGLTLTRDPQNGRVTGTTMGTTSDTDGYDANGLFASYQAKAGSTTLYAESVVRDALNRIHQKTETVQGTTHVWVYSYDATGRLTDVTRDGAFFSHYGYDADDNRTAYRLVRFGARDYDASVGRWTSTDPIGFGGGSLNIYGYALNDPVNRIYDNGMALLRSCAQAIASLIPAILKVNARVAENAFCPDPGHDKAIDQVKNQLQSLLDKAKRVCTDQDIAALGVAGVLAGAAAALLFVPAAIPFIGIAGGATP